MLLQLPEFEPRAPLDPCWDVEEAWLRWEMASCVERNGDHQWILEMFGEEDGGVVHLACEHCRATGVDIDPDYPDLLYGTVNGVEIEGGLHGSVDGFAVPVDVWVKFDSYFSPANMIHPECDVFVMVANRSGPSRVTTELVIARGLPNYLRRRRR